jgi:hypothetical protein
MRYATRLGCIAFARCRAILAQDVPGPIQRDRGSPNQYIFMMPDNGNVAIPYDYWRIKLKSFRIQAELKKSRGRT